MKYFKKVINYYRKFHLPRGTFQYGIEEGTCYVGFGYSSTEVDSKIELTNEIVEDLRIFLNSLEKE